MNYLARDSMSRGLITVNWKSNLDHAYDLMKLKSIRHLPVVNDESEIVGILSERDLLKAMKSEIDPDSNTLNNYTRFSQDDTVKDFMSWPVKTVHLKDSLQSVVHRMLNEKISSVLVVDAEHSARGIITTDDLISLLLTFLNEDTHRQTLPIENLFNPLWMVSAQ